MTAGVVRLGQGACINAAYPPMTRSIADYVALAVISKVSWDAPDDDELSNIFGRHRPTARDFSGDLSAFKDYAEERCGFPITDQLLHEAIRSLADCGLLRITDDNFSGTFVKIKANEFANFISLAQEQIEDAKRNGDESGLIERASDYPRGAAYISHELYEDYHELGDHWLKRALLGLQKHYSENGVLPNNVSSSFVESSAPASDRIVTFSDNQISDLEDKTSEIISAISAQNQIDGSPGLREILIGQLKAGRELIRAGSFKLYVLEVTLIQSLTFLAQRYEKETIGALAAALLSALLKHIGIDG